MKVSRQSDITESNKITCDWLDEFANNLAKSANLEYLDAGDRNTIRNNTAKFGTIEAKMADIKTRIGFEALMAQRDMHSEKIASVGCGCGEVKKKVCACEIKTAQLRHKPEDVNAMRQILQYIQSLIKHEPHLDYASIISRCREEDGMHFQDLPIDLAKLKDFIEALLSKESSDTFISYVPPEPISSGDSDDLKADYYQHAEPTV
jgi:hypothetical protein